MRGVTLVLLALAGCGRINFDPAPQGSGGFDSAPEGSGGSSPRWIRTLGGSVNEEIVIVAGVGDETVATSNFLASIKGDGVQLTGTATLSSTAVVRYDRLGSVRSATVLDSTDYCDTRGLTMRGDDAVIVGISRASVMSSALGACSVVTAGYQDPVAVRVDRTGAQTLVAHWAGSNRNAQGKRVAVLADGSYAMFGVYSGDLTIASPLPTAPVDPTAFLTRFSGEAGPVRWAEVLSSAVVEPGPMVADGNELCMLGQYFASTTVLGSQLTAAGGADAWVARVGPDGQPRYVRSIASPGEEDRVGASVAAIAGTCTYALAAGDLTVDGTSLPASLGAAVVLSFRPDGTLKSGFRLPARPRLVSLGGRLLAAMTVVDPLVVGNDLYTPEGADVIVVELGPTGPTRLVGAIGGSGDQTSSSFAAIGDAAVAIAVRWSGRLVFGATSLDATPTENYAVAVLDLGH